MLIQNLEKKIKLVLIVTVTVIIGSAISCISAFVVCAGIVANERKQIYVLNQGVPYLAEQTAMEANLTIEARGHINLFHQLFFTLAPDEKFIEHNIEKAMYLIDESGLKQKNTLQEKGFYSDILSSSATFTIMTDSIKFDPEEMTWQYYGTQRIERKTTILKRQLVTAGKLRLSGTRTDNNTHGLIITDFRTIMNKDLELKDKRAF